MAKGVCKGRVASVSWFKWVKCNRKIGAWIAGYVRRTSSRLTPDLNGDGKHMTIGRPLSDEDYDKFMNSRSNGKH